MPDSSTRTVIVVLPDGVHADWLRLTQILSWHQLPACVPVRAAFPVRTSCWTSKTRRHGGHLLEPVHRNGQPARASAATHASGGAVSQLDLVGLATGARQAAAARWRLWNAQIARSTPKAPTWPEFLAKARNDSTNDSQRTATESELRGRWEAQPRVLAMLAWNSYPLASCRWDLDELPAYQSGEAVYVALSWQQPLCGDALITAQGRLIQPASSSLADRLRYLAEATQVIHTMAPRQHLAAIQAAPAPTN